MQIFCVEYDFSENYVNLDIYYSELKYEQVEQYKAYDTFTFLSKLIKLLVMRLVCLASMHKSSQSLCFLQARWEATWDCCSVEVSSLCVKLLTSSSTTV